MMVLDGRLYWNVMISLSLLAIAGMGVHPCEAQESLDEDFAFQGEFSGQIGSGSESRKFGLQIIAIGNGKFRAVAYNGGLPGDGWDGEAPNRVEELGERSGNTVTFTTSEARGSIRDGMMTVFDAQGVQRGEMQKVARQSPTLGEKPPEGAIVLFDGSNVDAWEGLLPCGTEVGQRGDFRIRHVLEQHAPLLVIRGHKHWPHPLAQFPSGLQVLNVDKQVVILTK